MSDFQIWHFDILIVKIPPLIIKKKIKMLGSVLKKSHTCTNILYSKLLSTEDLK